MVLVGTGPRGGEGVGARPAWVGELFTRKYERASGLTWHEERQPPARQLQGCAPDGWRRARAAAGPGYCCPAATAVT
jgi:hypothetical protein